MFGSLFNKKDKGWQPLEVLGLTIGRGISFDPIALRLLPADSLIECPDTTLMITAQGHCDLGATPPYSGGNRILPARRFQRVSVIQRISASGFACDFSSPPSAA